MFLGIDRTCEVCGGVITHGRIQSVVCSPPCSAVRSKRRRRERQGLSADLVADRKCKICDGEMPQNASLSAKFCSKKCRDESRRNRYLRQGYNTYMGERNRLADRDGWRCYICGEEIVKELRRPDPMALEIDHLLPLNPEPGREPGEDEQWNLAAVHGICNRKKGNRHLLEAEEKIRENRIGMGLPVPPSN